MPVKGLLIPSFLIAALAMGSHAFAQDRPAGMLDRSFDLKKAVLSPTPLGPASRFEPLDAAPSPPPAEHSSAVVDAHAEARPAAKPARKPTPHKVVSSKPRPKPAVASRKPRKNPLDSYATDTRRQTWPCKGDGICAWTKR